MTAHSLPPATPVRRIFAWSVHAFTATGAVWGLLSILAIHRHDWRMSFIWIVVAILVDGVDGGLARLAHTRHYISTLDGALLANIVNYLNYVIVPAFFLIEAGLVPDSLALPVAAMVCMTSAYQFSQTNARTPDHYITGFPSYWNVLVLYLLVLDLGEWVNLFIFVLCGILVFVPVKYVSPPRTAYMRPVTMAFSYIWGAVGFWGLMQYPNVPAAALWVTLVFIVYYAVVSLIASTRSARVDQ
jgi:phosphatidylcholine synthase